MAVPRTLPAGSNGSADRSAPKRSLLDNGNVLRLLHAQLPLLSVVVCVCIFFLVADADTLLSPVFLTAIALLFGSTAIALVLPMDLASPLWRLPVVAADLIGIGLLRDAGYASLSYLEILAVFPILWLAYDYSWKMLALGVVGTLLIVLYPVAFSDRIFDLAMTSGSFVILPAVAGGIGVTVHIAAAHLRRHQDVLAATGERLQASLDDADYRRLTLEAVIETVDAAFFFFGGDDRLELLNQPARDLIKQSQFAPTDDPMAERLLFEGNSTTPVRMDTPALMAMLRLPGFVNRLYRVGHPGNQATVTATSRNILNSAGDVVSTVMIAHDVSRLIDATKARDEFLGTVSHELRTPLTSILGYIEIIEDSIDVEAVGITSELRVIQRNSLRLLELVSSLLSVGADRFAIYPKQVDLAAIVEAAVGSARDASERARLSIVVPEFVPATLFGDEDRLRQVVDNLLSNAIKYTRAGGVVTVILDQDDSNIFVCVTDDGVGMTPDDQKHVYERFFRAQNSRTDAIPGVGLGLPISKAIVEAHGGRISIESILGRGTSASVVLPRTPPFWVGTSDNRKNPASSNGTSTGAAAGANADPTGVSGRA